MPVGALRVFPQLFSSVVVNPVHTLVAIRKDFSPRSANYTTCKLLGIGDGEMPTKLAKCK